MTRYCRYIPVSFTPARGVNPDRCFGGVFSLSTRERNCGKSSGAKVVNSVQKSRKEFRYGRFATFIFLSFIPRLSLFIYFFFLCVCMRETER